MTTEEAIAKFERTSVLWGSASNTEMVEAVKLAITALRENQRLHELGITVEYLEGFDEDEVETIGDVLRVFGEWSKYRAVGTVEEAKINKDFLDFLRDEVHMDEIDIYFAAFLSGYEETDETTQNLKEESNTIRLIDANDFKKFLQALCNAGAPYHEVIQLLDKQPTAYDVEVVGEEIQKYFTEEAGKTVSEGIKEELKQHSRRVCKIIRNHGKECNHGENRDNDSDNSTHN